MNKIDSTFALLDVKKGRAFLLKRLGKSTTPVRVVIVGTLDPDPRSVGNDDGTSREFAVDVETAMEVDPTDYPRWLRDLAERLRHIPVVHGTDDGDIDQLLDLARLLEGGNV